MGSIVVYRDTDNSHTDAERQAGMVEAGQRVQVKLSANSNYKRAVLETLEELIDDANFDVRYEFLRPNGAPRSRALKKTAIKQLFELVSGDGSSAGHLILRVDRDDQPVDAFEMTIMVPRRSQSGTAFEYLGKVLDDLEAIAETDNQKRYLQGTLLFSRCR